MWLLQRPYGRALSHETIRAFTWIVAFAIVVRALLAIGAWLVTRDASVFHSPDTNSYLAPAREILSYGTFTVRGQPELVRTPGYSVVLLPGLWLGHLEATTIPLQIAFSVLTVLGIFVMVGRLFDDQRTALIAAALYSIEPLSVLYSAMLLTETVFTLVEVWGLVMIVVYVRVGRLAALIAGTALLAAGAYVRPSGYFLPFCLLGALAAWAALRRRREVLPHLALATTAAMMVVAPWLLRNRALGFRGMSAITAVNTYFYGAAALRAVHSGTSFATAQAAMGYANDSLYLVLHPEQRAWSPGQRFEFMAREGDREVAEDLPTYARIHLSGMARVLFDPGAIDMLKLYGRYPSQGGLLNLIVTEGLHSGLRHLLRTNPWAFALLIVFGLMLVAIYALAVRSLVTGDRFKDPSVVVLVASAAYFVIIAGGPAGTHRFRHAVMPIVCILAAVALNPGADPFSHQRQFSRTS